MCKIILSIGFGGSGKTTFINAVDNYLRKRGKRVYLINLDPAVEEFSSNVNIDIRDTINYKDVMNSHGLGPNGAISTCLNIFATKMDQVAKVLEKKKDNYDYVLIDVPGQIEVFTWSASGEMILKYLKSTNIPIEISYILDIKKCIDYKSFVSSVLYAYNTFYKLDTNIQLVFNKAEDPLDIMTVKEYLKNECKDETYETNKSYYDNLLDEIKDTIMVDIADFNPIFVSAKESIGLEYVL